VSVPDLLTAKINHGFDHLDADGDGQLTEDDHVLMGQRVAASLGHAAGSPAEQQIIDAYLRIWRELPPAAHPLRWHRDLPRTVPHLHPHACR
jgi:hypothetical protein